MTTLNSFKLQLDTLINSSNKHNRLSIIAKGGPIALIKAQAHLLSIDERPQLASMAYKATQLIQRGKKAV